MCVDRHAVHRLCFVETDVTVAGDLVADVSSADGRVFSIELSVCAETSLHVWPWRGQVSLSPSVTALRGSFQLLASGARLSSS